MRSVQKRTNGLRHEAMQLLLEGHRHAVAPQARRYDQLWRVEAVRTVLLAPIDERGALFGIALGSEDHQVPSAVHYKHDELYDTKLIV